VAALRRARRALRVAPLDTPELPPVPARARAGAAGMESVLRRAGATCLERSVVRQAWLAAAGDRRDVVIGVTAARDFAAHAWLDGEDGGEGYASLVRLPAR
jgi:Transglutaminase-like superfamily